MGGAGSKAYLPLINFWWSPALSNLYPQLLSSNANYTYCYQYELQGNEWKPTIRVSFKLCSPSALWSPTHRMVSATLRCKPCCSSYSTHRQDLLHAITRPSSKPMNLFSQDESFQKTPWEWFQMWMCDYLVWTGIRVNLNVARVKATNIQKNSRG